VSASIPGPLVESVDQLVEHLYGRAPEHRLQPRLQAVRRTLDLLGDPQRSYRIVHLTGTNGKTSTARMVASVLRAHNLRVGLFTSPHLVSFTERIVIDGEPIADEAIVRIWNEIAPYVQMTDAELQQAGEASLTFFEALTVLAFAAFADAPVDVVSLEVGMGGEWDSTNVADGEVAVFSPIALDHTGWLGDTVAEIARTKAGIIKPGAIAVSSEQEPEAMAELLVRAHELGVPLKREGQDFRVTSARPGVGGQLVSISGLAGTYADLPLPLMGEHQARNAALAVAAVEAFLGGGARPLSRDILADGLARATSPGRLQVVSHDPTVVVDAAHNPHGAAALAQAFPEYFHFPKTVGVVGILSDKNRLGILRALEPILASVVVTASESERAVTPDDLAVDAIGVFGADRVTVADSFDEALDEARYQCGEGDGILVTGSITLVGEAIGALGASAH
jgi:dihydrofolate synthase/folylpolyglutamate synthase